METKKSKVAKILHNTRSYSTQNGTFYCHQITFENGDSGTYDSKTETCQKFTEGNEASYTIETKVNGQYTYVKIKPAVELIPNAPIGFKTKSGSDESFALSYAKDLGCALLDSSDMLSKVTADSIIADAVKFYNWLKSKKI